MKKKIIYKCLECGHNKTLEAEVRKDGQEINIIPRRIDCDQGHCMGFAIPHGRRTKIWTE